MTADLLRTSAELARERGVRLHTHLAETLDEEDYCREHFGVDAGRVHGVARLAGPDVWFAHAVHLDDASIATMAATGHGRRALPLVQRPPRRGHRPGP